MVKESEILTVKETSEKWGIKEDTVWSYIKKGIILDLQCCDNQIIVPDINRPYIIRKNMVLNDNNIYKCILKASIDNKHLNYLILGIEKDAFKDAICVLEDQKYIKIKVYDDNRSTNMNVLVLPRGYEYIEHKRKIIIENINIIGMKNSLL